VKRLGWLHTLLWSTASLGRRFCTHIFVVASHPIDEDEGRDDPNAVGLDGHVLTPDEVLGFFNRSEGYSYSRAFASAALDRGDRCFGLLEDERLVWYCWYARESAPVFDDVDVVSEFPFLYAYNATRMPLIGAVVCTASAWWHRAASSRAKDIAPSRRTWRHTIFPR
jgi:hypothetical protein